MDEDRSAEARQAFLLQLTDALRPIADAGAIQREASRLLRAHLHADRVIYWESVGTDAVVPAHASCSPGIEPRGGLRRFTDFDAQIATDFRAGRTHAESDPARVEGRDERVRDAFARDNVGGWIGVPLLKDQTLRALLTVNFTQPHAWNDTELRLIEEVAERTWDAAERARTEAALRQAHDAFRHLVDHSPFGVYAVDADFRLVQVSAGAQRVFASVRPLLGRDFADVMHILWPEPFATEAVARFRHTLATGEPYHAPSTVERRQDTEQVESYDWQIERVTLPDGRPGVVCHFYDLSERLAFEDALRTADRQKDEFLAMLAHELRNPLAPIRNAAELLSRIFAEHPQAHAPLAMLTRQTTQLTRLVDDLLDVSRIAQGRIVLRKEPLELDALIDQAAETVQTLVREKSHRLVIAKPLHVALRVCGDRARLVQSLGNLLHNAAKYTAPGGEIRIELLERGDGMVEIRVHDTGCGIAPDVLPHVFDLFVQSERTLDRSQGGLGIGLSVVKRLIEMHGGEVRAESAGIGRGATFIVGLPQFREAERAGPDESGQREAGGPRAPSGEPQINGNAQRAPARRRVLIVDDNADAADSLAILLRLEGHDVETVYGGAAALDVAARLHPEVVLLDIGLPQMDGYEVARRMRALPPPSQDARLIALTGYGQKQDRDRAYAAGFDEHLVKPAQLETLRRILRDGSRASETEAPTH